MTGWLNPPGRSLDLFWARLLDASQVRAYSRLVNAIGSGTGSGLTMLAPAAGVTVILALLATFAAGARRLIYLVRFAPSLRAGPDVEESF